MSANVLLNGLFKEREIELVLFIKLVCTINSNSMKWWLIMGDIYRPAKKEGKYLLFCRTPKEVYRLLVCTIYTGDTTSGQKKLLYLRLYPDIWWKIRRFAIYSMDKCNYLKLVTIRIPKCFLFHWALFMSSKNAANQIFHF